MLTAGITAAVAAILGVFGIKPGAYLVGVAVGVKICLVAASVLFGAKWMRRRQAAAGSVARPPVEPAGRTPPST